MATYSLLAREDQIGHLLRLDDFPELIIKYIDFRNNLYSSNYNSSITCFWEGDLEITLDVNGYPVTLNDQGRDESHNVISGGYKYIFQGLNPEVVNSSRDQTYLTFRVKNGGMFNCPN